MDSILTFIDETFATIKEKAKNPNVSNDVLRDDLVQFLKQSGYFRTPYKIKFNGFSRARCGTFDTIEELHKEFKNLKDLSYPPDKFAKSCRCNSEGHSVFYCATDSGVPIFEVRPKLGQCVVLTTFKPINPTFELILPIIGVKQLRESLLQRDPNHALVKMTEDDMHYKSTHKIALAIDNRLAELFVAPVDESNQHIYRLTTAYYNGMVAYAKVGDRRVNALLYPSVESEITGYNIVMENSLVNENLNITGATIYQLEAKQGKKLFLRPLYEIADVEPNGNIRWEMASAINLKWILEPDTPVLHLRNF